MPLPVPETPSPSTLVVGPESLLAERAVAAVVTAARGVDPGTERVDVDGADPDAVGRLSDALAPTLFGGGSVVVVSDAEAIDDATLAALLSAVAGPPEGVFLVAVHPGGQKGRGVADRLRKAVATVVDVKRLKGREIDDFCVREWRRHRRSATPDAVAALRTAVGDDLRALAAACGQLATDVEVDPIDAASVTEYYDGIAGVKPYEVSDAVWDGRVVDALVALRWSLELDPKEAPLRTTGALAGSLRTLLALAGVPPGMPDRDAAAEIGLPANMSWKLRSLRQTLRRWPPRELARAAVVLAAVDAAVKGGSDGEGLDPVQKQLAIERAVVGIASSRRRADG